MVSSGLARADVPDIAILFTDGNSDVEPEKTLTLAAFCRSLDMRLIVVGVTDQYNLFELEAIASRPLPANLFLLPNTSDTARVATVTSQLLEATVDSE